MKKQLNLKFVILFVTVVVALWSPHVFAFVEPDARGFRVDTVKVPLVYAGPAWVQDALGETYGDKKYTVSVYQNCDWAYSCGGDAHRDCGTGPENGFLVVSGNQINLCVKCDCYGQWDRYYTYLFKFPEAYVPGAFDYDGDGQHDDVDPYPTDPLNNDDDSDGLENGEDPYPDDADCPLAGSWQRSGGYRHSSGCFIQRYRDVTGTCPDEIRTTNCGSGIVADVTNPCPGWTQYWNECLHQPDWLVMIDINSSKNGVPYGELFPSAGGTSSVGGDESAPSIPTTGGASGTVVPGSLSTDDLRKLADLLNGVQQVSGISATQLESIKKILGESLGYPDGVEGGEGAGGPTVGDQVKEGVEEAIEESAEDPGDTGIPGDPNAETIGEQYSDGDPTQGEMDDELETEQTNLTAFIEDWLSESPILAFFNDTAFETEGAVCSISCEVFGQEISFSLCSMESFLDLMGYFVLGLACVYAVMIVFGKG